MAKYVRLEHTITVPEAVFDVTQVNDRQMVNTGKADAIASAGDWILRAEDGTVKVLSDKDFRRLDLEGPLDDGPAEVDIGNPPDFPRIVAEGDGHAQQE